MACRRPARRPVRNFGPLGRFSEQVQDLLTPTPWPASKGVSRRQVSGGEASALYSLNPKLLWKFFKRQQISFWLVCRYTFFEYVRPQQTYESLLVAP